MDTLDKIKILALKNVNNYNVLKSRRYLMHLTHIVSVEQPETGIAQCNGTLIYAMCTYLLSIGNFHIVLHVIH